MGEKPDPIYIIQFVASKRPILIIGLQSQMNGLPYCIKRQGPMIIKAEAGNPARFFEFVLGGRLIFDYVKPTLQDMADDAGVPVEFLEALQQLQRQSQMELVLIEENGRERTQLGLEEHWPLAMAEFPNREIGFALIHRWHKLEVGDHAEFFPESFSITKALRGTQYFRYIPKEFVSGQVYPAEVAPLSERGGGNDLVRAYIKGHRPVDIPICFLPEAKEGDFVDVLATKAHMAGWTIAIPRKAYPAALELQQKIIGDRPLEAEITSDFSRASTVTWTHEWREHGYSVQIKVGDYTVKGFVLTGEAKGFKPGDKIAVKIPDLRREEYRVFVSLLQNIVQLRFEIADQDKIADPRKYL